MGHLWNSGLAATQSHHRKHESNRKKGRVVFDTDEEIEAYIAGLQGAIDEFRELIGSGRISGTRRERGRDYLLRFDARQAAYIERRKLDALERAATAAEATKREAVQPLELAARPAKNGLKLKGQREMTNVAAAFAKLAGIRKAVLSAMDEDSRVGHAPARPIQNFSAAGVGHYFTNARKELDTLRATLPHLYGDFAEISIEPEVAMTVTQPGVETERRFSRTQMARLARDIDQAFEIRANSELAAPTSVPFDQRRIFISHGRAPDWREVQAYIEKDLKFETLELAQEANQGKTILEKLSGAADQCDCAVIVMTGDDLDAAGQAKARENVIHEIGFFQGKYGLARICLLHEEGVSIPSNIHGLVYAPFPKGLVSASFAVLARELKAMYS